MKTEYNKFNNKLGYYIYQKRKELGYDTKFVSEKLKRTVPEINAWESGRRAVTYECIVPLCKLINIHLNDFINLMVEEYKAKIVKKIKNV